MTALQLYCFSSTVVFIALAVMFTSGTPVGLMFKTVSAVFAVFGLVVALSVSGILVSTGAVHLI